MDVNPRLVFWYMAELYGFHHQPRRKACWPGTLSEFQKEWNEAVNECISLGSDSRARVEIEYAKGKTVATYER